VDVAGRLKAFVAERYFDDRTRAIEDSQPLISSGVIDSFGIVDLSLFVEEAFGARIDASDLGRGRADTLSDIAALVESRRG
jgi:acyl carrier protein